MMHSTKIRESKQPAAVGNGRLAEPAEILDRSAPKPDAAAIEQALRLILEPGQVTELRILDAVTAQDRRPHVESGYFDYDHLAELAQAAASVQSAKGYYFVPNPVNPALLSRACNRARNPGKDPTTSDHDIERRRWLLIDCDCKRPAGISATDDEHQAAIERAEMIRDNLAADGWPDCIVADSGNGGHLLYRIDLPADDDGLVQRCLESLDAQFSGDGVDVDLTVFNPARIWKLYGTPAGKGDSTPDRPHRLSQILEYPPEVYPVPRDLLESLAAKAPKPAAPEWNPTANGDRFKQFSIDDWICEHGLDVEPPQSWQGSGRKWLFRACPFNSDHTDRSAIIGQRPDGKLLFNCSHNSCQKNDWHTLRELVEPGYRDRKASYQANGRSDSRTQLVGRGASESTASNERAPKFVGIPFLELITKRRRHKWRIKGMLNAEEPFIIGGPTKALKTNITIDLCESLAFVRPFLGRFGVEEACRVLFFSGESGVITIGETAARIALSKGISPDEGGKLVVYERVPLFDDAGDLGELRERIEEHKAELVIVDPTYLAMPGADAGNMMIQGAMLYSITETCKQAGAQLGLVHHSKGTIPDPFRPGELTDLAWAGYAPFARQWLMLMRRDAYIPGTGSHRLWLSGGGSGGHSFLWGADIEEGINTGADEDERFWDVQVLTAEEAKQGGAAKKFDAKQAEREATQERRVTDAMQRIVRAMVAKFPAGDSQTAILKFAGLDCSKQVKEAIGRLLQDGTIETFPVTKGNHKSPIDGLRLVKSEA